MDAQGKGVPEDLTVGEAPLARRLPAGEAVGPYRITGLLGEGGMGVVYRAEDTRLGRTVALKFVKARFTERFRREAQAVSALKHPHIATLYDIGTHQGSPYLVLEYVDGKPLHGPVPLAELLEYGGQTASALEAAHAAGIVHRDLKPGNILVERHGGVKVVDFGLARRAPLPNDAGDTETLTGVVAGTAAFMSPEQAEGKEVDSRSDVFSFGCVLYEWISGQKAFRGESTASVIAAVLTREPEPLRGLPPEMAKVLCRCLRKDPARRWQHIGDVRIALEDIRTEQECPVVAPKPSRARRAAWLALAAALAAAAYLGLANWRKREEPPAQRVMQVTDESGEERAPSLSPDGRTVLYASHAAGNWDIYSLRVGGNNPVNLTKDSPADDSQPAFSPDGERIAFRSERDGGGLFIMGASGESVRRLSDFCYLPAWSPDGKEIACSTVSPSRPDVREVMSSQLFAIDVESGKSRLLTAGVADAVQPNWSPNGRRIAFWGLREGDRDIYTISRDGTGVVAVTADAALDWDPVWAPDGKHVYFSSNRGGAMNVWRVAVDQDTGKPAGAPEPVRAPSTNAAWLSFSRSGDRLAYLNSMGSSNLYSAAFDPAREAVHGAPRALTRGVKQTMYPSVSNDGQWIAFTLQGLHEDIVVMKADGTQMRRVTDDAARDRAPRWSPNGQEIAFMSTRSGRFEIWTIRPDGSGARQVTEASPQGGVIYPAWAPDGRRLSYNLSDAMGFIIEAGKPWKEQQPQLARVELPPSTWFWVSDWSHDGRSVAGTVQRLDGATRGVGVLNLETGAFEQVTDFGQLPRWLPDGRRFLFHHHDGIYLADRAGKRTREVLKVPEAAINPYFDVSRDGRLIVFSVESVESDVWTMEVAR